MKAVILAGGYGTRLSEETNITPKPLVAVGDRPILWHIMKIYSFYGINDFIICAGYKSYMIKEYFLNYFYHSSDCTFHTSTGQVKIHSTNAEDWRVTVTDTGINTMTGGRLKKISKYLDDDEPFCMTYGDGVADVNINEVIDSHVNSKKKATVCAVRPPARFGSLNVINKNVVGFSEKPSADQGWINGGFFVLSKKCLDFIRGDEEIWERYPMEELSKEKQLNAYFHHGFWSPMDTLRDKRQLEEIWLSGKAPWAKWL